MTEDEVRRHFSDTGALLSGHFKLSSGLHSEAYLHEHPEYGWQAPLLRDMKAGPWTTFTPPLGGDSWTWVMGEADIRALAGQSDVRLRVVMSTSPTGYRPRLDVVELCDLGA